MLLRAKAYVEGALALVLYAARLDDEVRAASDDRSRAEAGLLLDVFTPIVKSWPSTYGLVANDLAIQVLGGYGYSRDYPVGALPRPASQPDPRGHPRHPGPGPVRPRARHQARRRAAPAPGAHRGDNRSSA